MLTPLQLSLFVEEESDLKLSAVICYIVLPANNEEQVIASTVKQVTRELANLTRDFEVIVVKWTRLVVIILQSI